MSGIFNFLKGGERRRKGKLPEPPVNKETRTYDEIMEEITSYNIDNTDILNLLRNEVGEERLATWSHALETGVRKGLTSPSGKVEDSPLFPVYLDLYRFVRGLRPKLLMNPTMKHVKGMERMDGLTICIVCGIRALQKERGAKRLMNTLQWKLLERYLG